MKRLLSQRSLYDSAVIESNWKGLKWIGAPSKAKQGSSGPEVFSMVTPPPNVTGSLHLGHALTLSIEDALVRRSRQLGKHVVWVPGCDHAGIATQVVVEKMLWQQHGLTRLDVGREAFLERVWSWKGEKEERITEQMKRMGCAFDWDRYTFTLQPDYVVAVTEAFCRLHEKGLIYREARAVNWCPALQSVVSDIETDVKDVPNAILHHVDYGNGIVIATTRPETIFADVAVAVHPSDSRYRNVTWCTNPLTGARLPVIRDDVLVDPAFGTGAVKVTPKHDVADHDSGVRNELALDVEAFGDDGKMHDWTHPQVAGMDRVLARPKVVEILKATGKYVKGVKHTMRAPFCSRTGDLLEPVWKEQWYVDCKQMSQRALSYTDAIIPEKFIPEWRHWLENSQDWCISRQLWWGHRIPAYQLANGTWVAGRSAPSSFVQQDPDVLDTWFSSAIFPLAAFGWPFKKVEKGFSKFYPLSVMETGSDILFFWVARMAMLCSELEPELGAPFRKVLLHPMVRDKYGRKMSKSVGNVIDPMTVIEGVPLNDMLEQIRLNKANLQPREVELSLSLVKQEFPDGIRKSGADALRFTLIEASENEAINFDMHNVSVASHFCNKIWNAARFVHARPRVSKPPAVGSENIPEKWMRYMVERMRLNCGLAYEAHKLQRCAVELRSFLLSFCDVYIEWAKLRPETDEHVNYWLHTAFDAFLREVYPLMPFITTELMGGENEVANFSALIDYKPDHANLPSEQEYAEPMEHILAVVSAVRGVKSARQGLFSVVINSSPYDEAIRTHLPHIRTLCRSDKVFLSPHELEKDADCQVMPVRGSVTMSVFPKDDTDTALIAAGKLAKLEEKLLKLEERWAKVDMSKAQERAIESYKRTKGILEMQIKAIREGVAPPAENAEGEATQRENKASKKQ